MRARPAAQGEQAPSGGTVLSREGERMTGNGGKLQQSAGNPPAPGDRLNPGRAAASVARWRRALAEALGGDPGGALDEPRHRLTLLKIFGSTSRLADLFMKYPAAAAKALVEGPSGVIAEAARDLSSLEMGVGGPDALHGALEPLKARVDLSIGVAEINHEWSASAASAARAEFAERLVETALMWLLRAGVNRGELSLDLSDGAPAGVFALAGGDFAHEDLAPLGPIDITILYDQSQHTGQAASMAERAFIRLGAEFREAFEGKSGDHTIFSVKTPLGSGLQGAGLVESVARASAALDNAQETAFRRFAATARIVAGDRQAGGAFLETAEKQIWGMEQNALDLVVRKETSDPRDAFRGLADILRFGLGRTRPVFRTGSAKVIFETAAASGVIPQAHCQRLVAGAEFTQGYCARLQMINGAAAARASTPEEENAIAALCGFSNFDALSKVLAGAIADAESAYPLLMEGPRAEFERYRPSAENPDDIDKLEDLGFSDGQFLSRIVDGWAGLAACADDKRFSALAPGLLTDFGQAQHPDQCIALFDDIMRVADDPKPVMTVAADDNPQRNMLVDAIGCFGAAVAPLATTPAGVTQLLTRSGVEAPQNGAEWLARHAPPAADKATPETLALWRRENIALIAKGAAYGDITFGVAAEALECVHDTALERLFATVNDNAPALTLHVFDSPMRGLPGAPSIFGFSAGEEASGTSEETARAFIEAAHAFDTGFFAVAPEISHRPGGVAGALAPDADGVKSYIQSEAVAYDQILLSRARVIAGERNAQDAARTVLRIAVANPKRADILFRDLDRARAQRMRRVRTTSEWDFETIEGGLHDVELIISTLIYRHAAAHPSIQTGSVDEALDALQRAGCVAHDVAATLKAARAFWLRLSVAKTFAKWSDPARQPVRPRFAALLARAAEVDSFQQVKPLMRGYADEVNRLYAQLVLGRPVSGLVANA
ncbi:MAG: hypothetical protein AAGJ73_15300 [Pseudomonadota bacterium]